jgi:hypothetical protein
LARVVKTLPIGNDLYTGVYYEYDVVARNLDTGEVRSLGWNTSLQRAYTCSPGLLPTGYLDGANCNVIGGWA